MDLYVTRDKDGILTLWDIKPKKNHRAEQWTNVADIYLCLLDRNMFPEVQWSDSEPTKVKLEIVKYNNHK